MTMYAEFLASYFWLDDKYYSVNDLGWLNKKVKDEEKLKELYATFNISHPLKDKEGHLISPKPIVDRFEKQTFDAREMCREDM